LALVHVTHPYEKIHALQFFTIAKKHFLKPSPIIFLQNQALNFIYIVLYTIQMFQSIFTVIQENDSMMQIKFNSAVKQL